MPVFKVVGIDRSRRIMIMGKTLEDIISSATMRLKLSDSEEGYAVCLEEDGTEIPDTDTLEELMKECPTPITLMVIKKNDEWAPKPIESLSQSMIENILAAEIVHQPADESIPPNVIQPSVQDEGAGSSVEPSARTATTQNQRHLNQPQNLREPSSTIARPMPLPWDKFPKQMIESFERGEPIKTFDRNNMVRILAEYLVDELKQADRTNCTLVAVKILKRYPDSFRVKINGSIVSDGKQKLITQIYNRVNYYRSVKDGAGKKQLATDSGGSSKSIQYVDEYGCAEYEPPLPLTESVESQIEKKKLLFEQADAPCSSRDVANIKTLLDETYPSQRIDINRRAGDIKEVLLDWPLLMEAEFQLHHASMLLGKPVDDIWRDNLQQNLVIHNLMKQYSISLQKSKRTKDNLHIQEINEILREAKQISTNMENKSALVLAIFPLVASYFKENYDFLFKVVKLDGVGDEQIEGVALNPSPILLINGESLYDTKATCAVIIERKICCLAKDALQGILVTFLAYYIFGLSYPVELSKTLEFMQRVLLDINPQIKSSKVKKGRRKASAAYTPAVLTFYNKLKQYYNEP